MRALMCWSRVLAALLLAVCGPAAATHAGACPGGEGGCPACHPDQARAVDRSPHATLAGIIGRTRYLWGAQPGSAARHGANGVPRPLPNSPDGPRGPAMLVDGFLRAFCLDCHVKAVAHDGGCTACHAPVEKAAAQERCLACHRDNHTGGDYVGRFALDAAPGARTGTGVHRLAEDVHARAGLACPDCHSGTQVMGVDREQRPSCAACHLSEQRLFTSRDGAVRRVPRPRAGIAGHDPEVHGRVRCSACHAQWFLGDYGLSVSRLDAPPPGGQAPAAPVRGLFADTSSGWIAGWRFRRWENAPLGVDARGRISVLRPRHQYLVSLVDGLGRVRLDSAVPVRGDGSGPGWAFDPYTPHTTAPAGRPCHECHGDPWAAGDAPDWAAGTDFALLAASPPSEPGARLLNPGERRRLMDPGPEYAQGLARDLAQRVWRTP